MKNNEMRASRIIGFVFVLLAVLALGLPSAAQAAPTDREKPVVSEIHASAQVNIAQPYIANYSDNKGVKSCDLYVDGSNKGSMTLVGAADYGFATKEFTFSSAGSHMMYASCKDLAGNTGVGAATTVMVTADNQPDTSAPTAPVSLRVLTTSVDNTPTIAWNASVDNYGVSTYEVQLDGTTFNNNGNGLEFTQSVALSDGYHTFAVRAKDAAGNTSDATYLTIVLNAAGTPLPFTLGQMQSDARLIVKANIDEVRAAMGRQPCEMTSIDAFFKIDEVLGTVSDSTVGAMIRNFMSCGAITTLHLGAGERLGVITSFRAAYGHLPMTETDWFNVMKISNGRFSSEVSAQAEANAQLRFKVIYLRDANMGNEHDKAAVTVMAYGLRTWPRRLDAETRAIVIFKDIFHHAPSSANDWDGVRAIAYSGATR